MSVLNILFLRAQDSEQDYITWYKNTLTFYIYN